MPGSSPFMTTREVAARLQCSARTVHELTRLKHPAPQAQWHSPSAN
jgi:hypothetical protein